MPDAAAVLDARPFHGFVYPVEQAARETRVILSIQPRRVTLDAIHAASETGDGAPA